MPRLIAAFEFALALGFFGALGLKISRLFGKPKRYLHALATLAAFPIAFLSAQLIRQTRYELHTSGALSSLMDTCTIALWPIAVVIVSFAILILAEAYAAFGLLRPGRSPEPLSIARILSRNVLLAMLIAIAIGSRLGWINWLDWRVNRPCL